MWAREKADCFCISAAVLLFFISAATAFAQTQPPKTIPRFEVSTPGDSGEKTGVKVTKDNIAVIEDIDALLKFAKLAKLRQEHDDAERALVRAVSLVSGTRASGRHAEILLELASVCRTLGKLETCTRLLNQAARLTDDATLRERIATEQHRSIYKKNRFANIGFGLQEKPPALDQAPMRADSAVDSVSPVEPQVEDSAFIVFSMRFGDDPREDKSVEQAGAASRDTTPALETQKAFAAPSVTPAAGVELQNYSLDERTHEAAFPQNDIPMSGDASPETFPQNKGSLSPAVNFEMSGTMSQESFNTEKAGSPFKLAESDSAFTSNSIFAFAQKYLSLKALAGFAAFISGGFIAVLIFSPLRRARVLHATGFHHAASNIIEKLLSGHEQETELWIFLALTYLAIGREDEHAISVYEKVLVLNILCKNQEKMSWLVAQDYLKNNRQDEFALGVLEQALKFTKQDIKLAPL